MKSDHLPSWPPPYEFRVSRRCKHLQLRMIPNKGLEVLSPCPLSERKILQFITSKKDWVIKHWVSPVSIPTELPEHIQLHAIAHSWSITYVTNDIKRVMLAKTDEQQLTMLGNIQDHRRCYQALKDWIKVLAEKHLRSWLDKLSQQLQLPFSDCSIRIQQTRWGSCSHDHKISLNASLLFLPQHLVEHVLIHELCHTVHLDHSNKFWKLVESHDPLYQQHRQELKQANHYVPHWCH